MEKKRITIEVPEIVHRKFKKLCEKQGTNLTEKITKLLKSAK